MINICHGRRCKNTAARGQRLCGKCKRDGRREPKSVAPADDDDLYRNANANVLIVRKPDAEAVEFHDAMRTLAKWCRRTGNVVTGDGRTIAGVEDEIDALNIAIGARKLVGRC
jgi:hypothetical protein